MKKASLKLETLACPSCVVKIQKAVESVGGVEKKSVTVRFNASKVNFAYNEEETDIEKVKQAIEKIGYQLVV